MKKKKIIRTGILAIIVFALVLFGGYTCLFSRTHYSFTRMTYSNGLLPDGFKNFKIVDLPIYISQRLKILIVLNKL